MSGCEAAGKVNDSHHTPLVFISYSHKDKYWKDELVRHLKALELDKQIILWDDSQIKTGARFSSDILNALNRSSLAVCLISRDFLSSRFIIEKEVLILLERSTRFGMPILPLLINKCAWKSISWLREINITPSDGKTLETDYGEDCHHDIFVDFADTVSEIVRDSQFAPLSPSEEGTPMLIGHR